MRSCCRKGIAIVVLLASALCLAGFRPVEQADTALDRGIARQRPVFSPLEYPAFSEWTDIVALETGYDFVAGLRSDGTVLVEQTKGKDRYSELDVSSWRDIRKIDAAGCCLLGLKGDGTVVATGESSPALDEVSAWKNVTDISTSGSHTVGVTKDGRLLYAGCSNSPGELETYAAWRDVDSALAVVCSSGFHTFGFRKDGTLINDGRIYKGFSSSGWLSAAIREDGSLYFWGEDAPTLQEELLLWTDLKQVCTGDVLAVGLRNDGRVLTAARHYELRETETWTDVDKLFLLDGFSDGYSQLLLVGVKTDGSLLATGLLDVDLSSWRDVVEIGRLDETLIGLKSDGTLLTSELAVKEPEEGEEEAKEAYEKAREENRPAFVNGWLTFSFGGDVYIPENFLHQSTEWEDGKKIYRFVDPRTDMFLEVIEQSLWTLPGVEAEGNDDVVYYLVRDGEKMEVIRGIFTDLCNEYPDAIERVCTDTFCQLSGHRVSELYGDEAYVLRSQLRGAGLYTLTITMLPGYEEDCRPIADQILEHFLN